MVKVEFFTNENMDTIRNSTVVEIPRNSGEVFVVVNDKSYRFTVTDKGDMEIALINGADVRVTMAHGYQAVKLIHT
jgi:hypothetical protein